MRPLVLAPAALALVASLVPGAATATESHTFTAPVPCAVTCPYWADPLNGNEAACRTPPFSIDGSFSDWNITVPTGFSTLHFEIEAQFFYDAETLPHFDSWMCYHPSNPGPNHTFFIETGANSVGWICPTASLHGCAQEIDYCISASDPACVAPGTNIIFRVYNWLDPDPSIIGTLDYLERR